MRTLRIALIAVLIGAAAWLLWPASLGGRTVYVTTHGTSMQPRFSTGDLAVLLPAASYAVGDVVAYHSASLNTVVMHRIVDRDGGAFVTKGDNNSWLDLDHPWTEQILGKLWFRVPSGGTALAALSSPSTLIWIAAFLLLAASVRPARRARRRRARDRQRLRADFLRPSTRRLPRSGSRRVAFPGPSVMPLPARARAVQVGRGAVVTALAAATLCLVLLPVPATQAGERTVEVKQQGAFSYSGAAVRGTTYPTGAVTTGDPIYRRLTDTVTVAYRHTVTAPASTRARLTGAVRLDVEVTASDGWRGLVSRSNAGTMDGSSGTASAVLDFASATRVLDQHYAEVGSRGGGSATLSVTPAVEVTGDVEGRRLPAPTVPGLRFTFDKDTARLSGDGKALTPSTATPLRVAEEQPRTFSVLGVTVPFTLVQRLAGAFLLAALLVAAAAAWVGRGAQIEVREPAATFVARHGRRVLPVSGILPSGTVVDLPEPEALHHLAGRLDAVVLHQSGELGDVFAVQDGDTTYRCVLPRMAESFAA